MNHYIYMVGIELMFSDVLLIGEGMDRNAQIAVCQV